MDTETETETPSDISSNDEELTNNDLQDQESSRQDNAEVTEDSIDESYVSQKVIDYILYGQDDKSEAERINWSESFLSQTDIESIYQDYLAEGGEANDIESFALYLTLNAPVLDNWKEMFESDFSKAYGEKITRYELLEDDLYQVYIEYEDSEVPYVVVSSRTGYFHG